MRGEGPVCARARVSFGGGSHALVCVQGVGERGSDANLQNTCEMNRCGGSHTAVEQTAATTRSLPCQNENAGRSRKCIRLAYSFSSASPLRAHRSFMRTPDQCCNCRCELGASSPASMKDLQTHHVLLP